MIGLYKITNNVNGKFYIGSSVKLEKRIKDHKWQLKNGIHSNIHLARAAKKYGLDAFSFSILETCSESDLLDKEQRYLDEHVGSPNCYNISCDSKAPNRGSKSSKEVRAKISKALLGRTLSQEHRQNIGRANKGNVIGEIGRQNMSRAHLGTKLTEIQKTKIGKALSGENAPLAKLNWLEVKEIRELYPTGSYSARLLSEIFGVKDKKTILNIIHQKTWK